MDNRDRNSVSKVANPNIELELSSSEVAYLTALLGMQDFSEYGLKLYELLYDVCMDDPFTMCELHAWDQRLRNPLEKALRTMESF